MRLISNLMCGFPDDGLPAHPETMARVPLIVHLQPPSGLWHLSIDLFSPPLFRAVDTPCHKSHAIASVQTIPSRRTPTSTGSLTTSSANIRADTHRQIQFPRALSAEVRAWNRAWQQEYRNPPELKLCRHEGRYFLIETADYPIPRNCA